MKVALVGATGMTGRHVLPELLARGHDVVAVGRNPEKLAALDPRAERRIGDFDRPETLPAALAGVDAVAYVAHAKHTGLVHGAMAPDTPLVVTGSVRVFTKLPDPAAESVRTALYELGKSQRPSVVLLPSMIYGAAEDRNVGRVLRFLARFPRAVPIPVPLPDGGRHTVQPIHVDDLASCVVSAIERVSTLGRTPIIVAGPEPITYARFMRECAAAIGRRVWIVPVPVRLLVGIARVAKAIGLRVPFDALELRRAAEDKAFDVTQMHEALGIVPRAFAEGVRQKAEAKAY
ncbi:MAG: NAD(P)H-binding protein [Alphaproteobacteria bacterium]|nr:NAD(P)H-binding protein [Alphaproteobacteria bacterium]